MPSAESTHIFNLGPDWQETGGQEDRSRGPNHPHLIPSSYYANMNVTLSHMDYSLVWESDKSQEDKNSNYNCFYRSLPPVDSPVSHLALETSTHVACCDFLVISRQLHYYDHCLPCCLWSAPHNYEFTVAYYNSWVLDGYTLHLCIDHLQ